MTEIADSTVTIEAISREPGYRSKIAVSSKDPKVDPVGACVGARGARVKSIVRELGGEKIDIIRYRADPIELLTEAIKPAVPRNIKIDQENKKIAFEVSEEDLSIAIGRRGQNARLTSRLMGWKLDIAKEQSSAANFDTRVAEAVKGWNGVEGISTDVAKFLVENGFTSPEAFEGVGIEDLTKLGFKDADAKTLLNLVQAHRASHGQNQAAPAAPTAAETPAPAPETPAAAPAPTAEAKPEQPAQ